MGHFRIYFLIPIFFIFSSCKPAAMTANSVTDPNPTDLAEEIDEDLIEALAWEKKVPTGKSWSQTIYQTIENKEPSLLEIIPKDYAKFCPRYPLLSKKQKLNFWGQLIAAMSKFESNWKPVTRYVETTMGKDIVTGETIASEGLLQLSYQDVPLYNNLCEFDWIKDQALHRINPNDPKKTIFDPHKNLACGVHILARLINRHGQIAIGKGSYWAVIKTDNPRNRLVEIQALTKSLLFCE